eukprot:594443-Karenia_brevis.AAC.1
MPFQPWDVVKCKRTASRLQAASSPPCYEHGTLWSAFDDVDLPDEDKLCANIERAEQSLDFNSQELANNYGSAEAATI